MYIYYLLSIRIIRYMTGCACETADCDKIGFLNLCLTFQVFSSLWPHSLASPFAHILKEQEVNKLITKVKAIFSYLFFPESLFAFNTKSFLLINLWGWGGQLIFRLLSDDKWEQMFLFCSVLTWTSVKRELSPFLQNKKKAVWYGSTKW